MRAAFIAGIANDAAPAPICRGDERTLSNATSEPMVDVSAGAPSCGKASLFCLGKADDSDNPFADDPTTDEVGGCSTSNSGGLGASLAVALALLARRRRR
jgi:MYXO-CTERM domain-containing protein